MAAVAAVTLSTVAHAGDDGYNGRVAHWKGIGWYSIEALPDLQSCSATSTFKDGTMLIIMALPDQFTLTLGNSKWSTTFLKGQQYAPTIELDNKWENGPAKSMMDGVITISNMGKPMVAAFMEADGLGLSMNGGTRLAVLDLQYTRSVMQEVSTCAVAMMNDGQAATSSQSF